MKAAPASALNRADSFLSSSVMSFKLKASRDGEGGTVEGGLDMGVSADVEDGDDKDSLMSRYREKLRRDSSDNT